MEPIDVFNDSRGLSDFLSKMYGRTITQQQRTDGTNMYNTFLRIKNNSNNSINSGTSFFSGTNNSTDSPNFLTNAFTKLTNAINAITIGSANVIQNLYQSQIGQGTSTQNFDAINETIKLVQSNGLISFNLLKDMGGLLMNQFLDQLKKESELRSKINEQSSVTGILSEKMREDIVESSISAQRYGFTMEEISDLYVELTKETGKFSILNKKIFDDAAPIVRTFVSSFGELSKMISNFENVGIGTNETLKTIEKAGVRSISLGLNARKTTELLNTNISKLNEFGFQNGVKGLETMIRKSLEFKNSLESVYTIANNVFEPEKALELSANLQVLGGAIGDFGDPIKLMYDATNNVEGLQDALIGASKSLATYNTEQGRFEITGVNLRRLRAMADSLGIKYEDLTKTAISAAERMSATTALMSTGLNINDADKEFLLNLSRMDGGEMKIIIPESIAKQFNKPAEIALDKLDKNTYDALTEYRKKMESLDTKELAMEQLTETERMARDINVIAAYYKVRSTQMVKGIVSGSGIKNLYDNLRNVISDAANEKIKTPEFGLDKKMETKTKDFINNYINIDDKILTPKSNNQTSSVKNNTENSFVSKEVLIDSFSIALQKYDNIRRKDKIGVQLEMTSTSDFFNVEQIMV